MPPLPMLMGRIVRTLAENLIDPENPVSRKALLVGAVTASGVRLAAGTRVGRMGERPKLPMRLWDCETSPFARPVREALSTLDLDAEVFPCPQGGARYLPQLGESAVRLEDPNTAEVLEGSPQILRHLYTRYGEGSPPILWNTPPLRVLTDVAVGVLTAHRGAKVRPSRQPEQRLELWSFESSPYCRLVRALLCELELPYLLHNVAQDSPRREAFAQMSGKMQVPYLYDPNTNTRLFESRVIEQYLEQTYAV